MTKEDTPFEIKTLYALTITPENSFQFLGKTNRYELFRQALRERLNKLGCLFSLHIEASEVWSTTDNPKSVGPRLHAHGIIYIRDASEMREFLLYGLYGLQMMGTYKMKPITDLEGWKTYCTKQNWVWQRGPLENCDLWDPKVIKSVRKSVSSCESSFFVDQTS